MPANRSGRAVRRLIVRLFCLIFNVWPTREPQDRCTERSRALELLEQIVSKWFAFSHTVAAERCKEQVAAHLVRHEGTHADGKKDETTREPAASAESVPQLCTEQQAGDREA
jgi:hypothetical protein